MDRQPMVGVFDSGVGGLSVVRALLSHLPAADIIYVADSTHCPYGSRSQTEIATYSIGIARYLLEQGADTIVVACNTASAAALSVLRETFDVPFVGMVPAVKPAAALTKTGVIGVLATPATFDGLLFEDVVEHYAQGVRVLTKVCPGLVEAVEEGEIMSAATQQLLRGCLEPMMAEGVDALVLGCTHYPFLEPAIRVIAGDALQIVEPSQAIARQTGHVLAGLALSAYASGGFNGICQFATTGDPLVLRQSIESLLGLNVETVGLAWVDGNLARPT